VTTQQSATAPGSIVVSDVSAAQSPKIAVLVGGGMIQVYDLSDSVKPVKAATHKTPSGRPLRVSLNGSLVYVADGREGLQVVDLSTPSMPRVVGTYKTPNPARDVAAADSLVFVVAGPLPQAMCLGRRRSADSAAEPLNVCRLQTVGPNRARENRASGLKVVQRRGLTFAGIH